MAPQIVRPPHDALDGESGSDGLRSRGGKPATGGMNLGRSVVVPFVVGLTCAQETPKQPDPLGPGKYARTLYTGTALIPLPTTAYLLRRHR